MNKWCEKEIAEMIKAVTECKNPAEVCEIFDAVLTTREINDMARRYKILNMLKQGNNYSDICITLGVSNDMISRVSTKMGYGFRRTCGESQSGDVNQEPKKRSRNSIKYKGSPSITDIIFPA